MKLNVQKRLAAEILGVGESRIWLDPSEAEEISKAITRQDVYSLIKRHIITVKPKQGISRGRAKALKLQRMQGRRKGHGRRKGAKGARTPAKREWINRVRPLRVLLKTFKAKGKITAQDYNMLYKKVKGNFFRNRSHLKTYVDKLRGA